MTEQLIQKAIFQLENIDYEDEFAYEQANKAFQSINHIPVFFSLY